MHRLHKKLRQLFQRFHLWWYTLKHPVEDWVYLPPLLLDIAGHTDSGLLYDYTRAVGQRIEFTTSFKDSWHLLEWLDSIKLTMETGDGFREDLVMPFTRRNDTSLESFLRHSNGQGMPITAFVETLTDRIVNLAIAYSNVESERSLSYYNRVLPKMLLDVFTVQEAVLIAAINL